MLDVETVKPTFHPAPPPKTQNQPSLGCEHFPLWCSYDCRQQALVAPQGQGGCCDFRVWGSP